MALLAGGIVGLTTTGHLGLPFQRVVTLRGRLASVGDLFEDPQVVRILRRNGLRVITSSAGSREVATGSLKGLDFVFPSGESAADQIHDERQQERLPSNDAHPFYSPLVLATYGEYAEALARNEIAVRHGSGKTLYYKLDMKKFLARVRAQNNWGDLGITGPEAQNLILAQTSDICQSNSADSYLGLVSYTLNDGKVPTNRSDAQKLAGSIAPLLLGQGSPGADMINEYERPDGPGVDPVVVVYEHEYLQYQAEYRAAHSSVDGERVLLYTDPEYLSEPDFIALDDKANRLGKLLTDDPELRRRESQLGYRLFGTDGATELSSAMAQQHVPLAQGISANVSFAHMPDYQLLDLMINKVESCPKPVQN